MKKRLFLASLVLSLLGLFLVPVFVKEAHAANITTQVESLDKTSGLIGNCTNNCPPSPWENFTYTYGITNNDTVGHNLTIGITISDSKADGSNYHGNSPWAWPTSQTETIFIPPNGGYVQRSLTSSVLHDGAAPLGQKIFAWAWAINNDDPSDPTHVSDSWWLDNAGIGATTVVVVRDPSGNPITTANVSISNPGPGVRSTGRQSNNEYWFYHLDCTANPSSINISATGYQTPDPILVYANNAPIINGQTNYLYVTLQPSAPPTVTSAPTPTPTEPPMGCSGTPCGVGTTWVWKTPGVDGYCCHYGPDDCASDACVGLPYTCQDGTWQNTNSFGECTPLCTGCRGAPISPIPTTPPDTGHFCYECGFTYYWGQCGPKTAIESWELWEVFGCGPNWEGQTYGPGKDQLYQCIANADWECNNPPYICSPGWPDGQEYAHPSFKPCVCGEYTSQTAVTFSTATPIIGQSFTVEATSYKGLTGVLLGVTYPGGGDPVNLGGSARAFSRDVGGYTQYVWQWDYSPLLAGTYTFRVYASSSYECASSQVTVTAPFACNHARLDDGFRVCYFDGLNPDPNKATDLAEENDAYPLGSSSSPVGSVTAFDHNWGTSTVNNSGKTEQVSGEWKGRINFKMGTYVFHVWTDDGFTLDIDGSAVSLSNRNNPSDTITWKDQGDAYFDSQPVYFNAAGYHDVTLRWYENTGSAAIKLWWDYYPPFACDNFDYPYNQFRVCYVNGINPEDHTLGNDLYQEYDGSATGFYHDWQLGEVDTSGKTEEVSGTWRGTINFQPGNYRFHTWTDDGVTLDVEGAGLIINEWHQNSNAYFDSLLYYLSGDRKVTLRWYENTGSAAIGLWWDVVPLTCTDVSLSPPLPPNPMEFAPGDPPRTLSATVNYVLPAGTNVAKVAFTVAGDPVITINPAEDTSGPPFTTVVTPSSTNTGTATITADAYLKDSAGNSDGLPKCQGTKTVNVTSPPWFQISGGDVHAEGDLSSRLPSSTTYFSLAEVGVVSANGSTDFGLGSVSSPGWLLEDYYYDKYSPTNRYDYDYFLSRAPTLNTTTLSNENPTQSELQALGTGSDSFYLVTSPAGDLRTPVDTTWNIGGNQSDKKVVIFVPGNLYINGRIKVGATTRNNFSAIFVKGNIIMDGNYTTEVEGIYVADGQIDTGLNTDLTAVFLGRGSFIAHGGFNLRRQSPNPSTTPAEKFVYDPHLLLQAPPDMTPASFVWQEVAP